MDKLQTLIYLDLLSRNWEKIIALMGSDANAGQIASIAAELSTADMEKVPALVHQLLDLTEDTGAEEFVNALIERADLGGGTLSGGPTRGSEDLSPSFGMSARTASQVLDSAGEHPDWTSVPVFYATNRLPSGDDTHYTGDPGALVVGLAHVTIPDRHKLGRVEVPKWWRNPFSWIGDRDPAKWITTQQVEALKPGRFQQILSEAGTNRDVLVFNHGFNVTFEEALIGAAQFAYDVKFDGVVILYSWPSIGKMLAYLADGERAAGSVKSYSEFLKMIDGGPWKDVHVLSHSMGNRVMTSSLSTGVPLSIRNVVMVAADVPTSHFESDYAAIREAGDRLTSYATKSDLALKASSLFNQASRVGQVTSDGPFCLDGMEAVDATHVNTGLLGHSSHAQARSVLTDIGMMLRHNHPASERGLTPKSSARKQYWIFPE